MEFRFDSNQDFQLQAIESICDIFAGHPRIVSVSSVLTIPNILNLDEDLILKNLHEVQARNNLSIDQELKYIEYSIETNKYIKFANLSVEMETGTGKTYVYLRTIFELNKRYGLKKFIVVVPSVAIKEGVIKTIKMTKKHFEELYSNTPCHCYVYDSSNLTNVKQFAESNSIEIMVMTLAAFNKDANLIRQSTDELQGEIPLKIIQSVNPILILDEPQNMESENSIKSLGNLHPLIAIRYSATHRNPYNLVYKLSPYAAFKKGLVKRIEVASVIEKDESNKAFIHMSSIKSAGSKITAELLVHKLTNNGNIKDETIKVKVGDSLKNKTNLEEYDEYDIEEINPSQALIRFSNGIEVISGETIGTDKKSLFEAQIRYTIEEHFKKQQRLKNDSIKVLSLFFIDKVDNYTSTDGLIRKIFNNTFDELKLKYTDWLQYDADEIQSGYFAQTKKRSGEIEYEDSTTGTSQKDEKAYNLIMIDKERLLSFEEPVSFIFSHSALKEGWDNPNIFQICTLNSTSLDMRKRQEIGRGIRLAVNKNGERINDERVNILTVVANESYEQYVSLLQSNYKKDYDKEDIPEKPPRANRRITINLEKERVFSKEFQDLWERIKHKTRYAVKVDTTKLINETVEKLNKVTIKMPRIVGSKASVNYEADGITYHPLTTEITLIEIERDEPLPDLIGLVINTLLSISPPICLTRITILEIFKKSDKKEYALKNPHGYAIAIANAISECIIDQLIDGIKYEKIDKWYEMTCFKSELEGWDDSIISSDKCVYDHVIYDSDVEKKFAEQLNKMDDVIAFVKLPNWFKVPTPIGNYNPDWAVVVEQRDEHGDPTVDPLLYLVRETKDENWINNPRINERRKTDCGKKHFTNTLGVDFGVVSDAKDIIT